MTKSKRKCISTETTRPDLKDLKFCPGTRAELMAFPPNIIKDSGFQLDRIQRGLDPDHWKPFESVGKGVNECIIDDASGWYRVLYIAKFEEAVYVLHCFQKKTNQTSQSDIDLAKKRLSELKQDRQKKGLK